MNILTKPAKFELGTTVITRAINESILDKKLSRFKVMMLIRRHHTGDWGDLGEEDKQANESALEDNTRLFSCYKVAHNSASKGELTVENRTIYIITEWDRALTTVLYSEDY